MTRIYISAAEPSANQYAFPLIQQLLKRHPEWAVMGMADDRCRLAGFEQRVSPEGLDLIGGVEVLVALPLVKRKLDELQEDIEVVRPDLFIPIDLPGFHYHLLRRVRKSVKKVLYFVPPMVYGRKANRAHKLKPLVDACVVIFPFDLAYYRQAGVPVYFFGHPLVCDRFQGRSPGQNQVLLLPGSREKEVSFFVPFFQKCVKEITRKKPWQSFHMVFASKSHYQRYHGRLRESGLPVSCSFGDLNDQLSQSICAVAVSGTVTLQVALAQVPQIIVYKVSPITAYLARLFVLSVHQIGLPNLILQQKIVPERVGNLRPEVIASDVQRLLDDPRLRLRQQKAFALLREKLQGSGELFESVAQLIEKLLIPASSLNETCG